MCTQHRRIMAISLALALFTAITIAEETELDISRIALFSSGVGYFERAGQVAGDTTIELKFRTEQINDIIKSMIVQDLGGGTVGEISYASRDPLAKTLRSFAVDLTGDPSLAELLDQLRGEPVEVNGPRTLAGVIVGVEQEPVFNDQGETIRQIERLTVLTDAGLQQVELTAIEGIELTNEKIAAELRKALAALAAGHDADKKTVAVHFEGAMQRQVRVAYLLEAPIWKTSYRLALSDEDDPFLQGWATVDNATEEDWNNVRLSLVSGRPISFRMDLYTPLYVPRPVEQLELYASLRPPDYEGAMGLRPAAEPSAEFARSRASAPRRGGVAGGRGRGLRDEAGKGAEQLIPWDVDVAFGSMTSVADAQEAGELFEYRIDHPVTIPRQHSAMLPIVNQRIEGTKVSIYNPNTHAKYPLNGLELKNTTDLNLMQGPVTVFDDDVYAGDAKLPDLKPEEERLIAYALDLSTEVMVERKSVPQRLLSLRIAKGTLWRQYKHVDKREYVIRNKAQKERTVILEQPFGGDWDLVQPQEAYQRTSNLLRFKETVPAQSTERLTVELERTINQSLVLSNAGFDEIRYYLRSSVITDELKQALERVVELRTKLDELVRQRERLEQERQEMIAEQARIRENLKTLDRNTDAYRRQLEQFDKIDRQIAKLRDQIGQARDAEAQQRKTLEQYLLRLNVG